MTGPEIAQRTGLTADSVRVNLVRGMKTACGRAGGSRKFMSEEYLWNRVASRMRMSCI